MTSYTIVNNQVIDNDEALAELPYPFGIHYGMTALSWQRRPLPVEIQCDDCGDRFETDERWSDYVDLITDGVHTACTVGQILCRDYERMIESFDDHMVSCSDCGDRDCAESDGTYWEDGDPYCYSCAVDYRERRDNRDNDGLRAWNYRPSSWRPRGDYPDNALMGIELEVDGSVRDILSVTREHAPDGHLYCAEDGSIAYGCEIISHPQTLHWAKREFDYPALLADLNAHGCTVGDGHGLHVHVSRNAFRRDGRRSTLHTFLWASFIYASAPYMAAMGRRNPGRWGRFACTGCRGSHAVPASRWWSIPVYCNDCYALMTKAGADSGYCHDRYRALNWNNSRTVELRFPRATLDRGEFMSTLELVDATVEYTRVMRVSDIDNAMRWSSFRSWVDTRDDYEWLPDALDRIGEVIPGSRQAFRVTPVTASWEV